MAQNRTSGVCLERKQHMKEFKGVWMQYEVVIDKKLSDKGKIVYSKNGNNKYIYEQ